ncbi:hypothetical protein E8E13_002161 [Curvularia kusanoi]|uniref:Uncharacterized protein n=1 Tax=Curvularia kusanoi TaxID=90978 RepID=A0A9P4T7C8_CURKU|nr:hypothetical protein E8E13_002161 [Curvularia kusanoi]
MGRRASIFKTKQVPFLSVFTPAEFTMSNMLKRQTPGSSNNLSPVHSPTSATLAMASSTTTMASPAHSTTSSTLTATESPAANTSHTPLSPPTTPKYPTPDAKVAHYTPPPQRPRFPRHPCPTPHHTLSLLASEHEAQRLFGPDFSLRSPETGELQGPFALLGYTDAWIPKYCRYIHSVLEAPGFSRRERELVVAAVVAVSGARWVGSEMGGLGKEVGGLSARERNVGRLAGEMVQGWGRVAESTWREVVVRDGGKSRGVEGWLEGETDVEREGEMGGDDAGAGLDGDRLTREEAATLAQVVASVMFVSVLVNCAEGGVTEGEAGVLEQP